jgi:nucleoside-diphosphate-sugar epimerase
MGDERRRPARSRILITGSTGFVGSAVLRALCASPASPTAPRPRLRLLVRAGSTPSPAPPGTQIVHGDLTEPASLRGLCEDVSVVLHLASHIGADAGPCRAVNEAGTRLLVAEAARDGVRHFVYLSTCGVYGEGVHRDAKEADLVPAPVSTSSRTRLAAEREVLAGGGLVLRPHLVYGEGDRWVVPAVAALLRRLPGLVDHGRARASMIAVDDLARLLVAAARGRRVTYSDRAAGRSRPAGVYHANHPVPVTVRDLVRAVAAALGLPAPRISLPLDRYLDALRERAAMGARAALPSDRHVALLAGDRWYESSRIWRATGCPPGPGFARRFAGYAAWYRTALAAPAVPGGGPRGRD